MSSRSSGSASKARMRPLMSISTSKIRSNKATISQTLYSKSPSEGQINMDLRRHIISKIDCYKKSIALKNGGENVELTQKEKNTLYKIVEKVKSEYRMPNQVKAFKKHVMVKALVKKSVKIMNKKTTAGDNAP